MKKTLILIILAVLISGTACAEKNNDTSEAVMPAEPAEPEVVVLDMPVGNVITAPSATPEPAIAEEPTVMPDPTVTPEPTVAAEPTATPEPAAAEEPQPFWFEDTKVAQEHSQLIIVGDANGTTAPFTLYEKDEGGVWTEVFSVTSYIGRHGYNDNRHQGDETTPTGVYHFTQAFGIADDPGCTIGYTKVNEHHYWVGNSDSPYYNTMISDLDTSNFSKKSSEHLIAYDVPYQYCLNISFNSEQTPGRGSAIFLHCYSERQDTGGCVAIPQKYMKQLLCRLKPDCVIAIDADVDDLNGEVL